MYLTWKCILPNLGRKKDYDILSDKYSHDFYESVEYYRLCSGKKDLLPILNNI